MWKTNFKNRTASAYDPELDQNVYRNLGSVEKVRHDGVGGVGARYRHEQWGHVCWNARPAGAGPNGFGIPSIRCISSMRSALKFVLRDTE